MGKRGSTCGSDAARQSSCRGYGCSGGGSCSSILRRRAQQLPSLGAANTRRLHDRTVQSLGCRGLPDRSAERHHTAAGCLRDDGTIATASATAAAERHRASGLDHLRVGRQGCVAAAAARGSVRKLPEEPRLRRTPPRRGPKACSAASKASVLAKAFTRMDSVTDDGRKP
eukprot:SRR837773.9554.p2 GENE.SRR837773.9554~~SRR837773.9554.p2  ORF type:complete len:170 (+),score=23.03 SRR837773.9554:1-510(+)